MFSGQTNFLCWNTTVRTYHALLEFGKSGLTSYFYSRRLKTATRKPLYFTRSLGNRHHQTRVQ